MNGIEDMLTAGSHRPTAAVRVAQLGQDAGLRRSFRCCP
jgi:hypothetical protein